MDLHKFCWSTNILLIGGSRPWTASHPPTRIRQWTINVRCSLVSSRGTIIVHTSQYHVHPEHIISQFLYHHYVTQYNKGYRANGYREDEPWCANQTKYATNAIFVLQNSNTACMIRLIDTECVCLECTLIETYVRTHHDFTESANSIWEFMIYWLN